MWLLQSAGESSLGVKGLGLDTRPGRLGPCVSSHSRFVWTKCFAPEPSTGLKAHIPAHQAPPFIETPVGPVNGGPVAAQLDTPLQNPGIKGDPGLQLGSGAMAVCPDARPFPFLPSFPHQENGSIGFDILRSPAMPSLCPSLHTHTHTHLVLIPSPHTLHTHTHTHKVPYTTLSLSYPTHTHLLLIPISPHWFTLVFPPRMCSPFPLQPLREGLPYPNPAFQPDPPDSLHSAGSSLKAGPYLLLAPHSEASF